MLTDKWLTAPIQTALLSYPRSGNTWMRYCIEYLTKQPTNGMCDHSLEWLKALYRSDLQRARRSMVCPLGIELPLGVDMDAPAIVHKKHNVTPQDISPDVKLIIIVRDFKECLIRNKCYQGAETTLSPDWREKFLIGLVQYCGVIHTYLTWPAPKLLVYYNDLVTVPGSTLNTVLNFLNTPAVESIDAFVKDIEKHRKQSVEYYTVGQQSYTGGQPSPHYHTKSIDPEAHAWMTAAIAALGGPTVADVVKRFTE